MGRKKSKSSSKPVFHHSNGVIMAGGIMFVRAGSILLSTYYGKLADIGGKVDKTDASIYETIAREANEETNWALWRDGSALTTDELQEIIQANMLGEYYIPVAKYWLCVVTLPDDVVLDMEKVGDTEILDNIKRTLSWMDIDTVLKKDDHDRGGRYSDNWNRLIHRRCRTKGVRGCLKKCVSAPLS